MIKIAYLIDNLEIGGAQTMVARLASNINNAHFSIKVFVLRGRTDNEIEREYIENDLDCEFINIGNDTSILRKIRAIIAVSKALRKYNPDIIHSHLDFFYSPIYCAFHKPALMVTIHGWPDRVINRRFKVLINSCLLRKKTMVIGCANVVSDRLKELLPKANVISIYNPINVGSYSSIKFVENTEEDDSFTYIHVGRLSRIKNQKMMIEAFSMVTEVFPNSKLLIIGDGELKNELERTVKQLKLDDKVLFMGQRYDIPALLHKSDVFLLSSSSECCPMSILEAMASSLPIVATKVGGVPEIVGDAGICIDVNNVNKYAKAMISLQKSIELRDEFREKAKRRVEQFDSRVIACEYETMYEDIAK